MAATASVPKRAHTRAVAVRPAAFLHDWLEVRLGGGLCLYSREYEIEDSMNPNLMDRFGVAMVIFVLSVSLPFHLYYSKF